MDTNPIENFRNITLECSLKPFKSMDQEYIEAVAEELFRQWRPLTDYADGISVLMWQGDGTEIFIYSGDQSQEMEWAKYIGGAGLPALYGDKIPKEYMDNPPVITYGDLGRVVAALKKVGKQVTGKDIRVGTTFDPGPEFVKSPFKFDTHKEIIWGKGSGYVHVVTCLAKFNADTERYAGFPEGIPEGTTVGTFLGRQSRHFMEDLGFEYIWFSNGFGFGTQTWSVTGCIFDGKSFDASVAKEYGKGIIGFWKEFRAECPDFPIETRGTNLPAGIDIGTDAVPLKDIYKGGFNMMPPPNSPWAALDEQVGLEMAGYMSRLSEIPSDEYPFRFYTHDPWWLNSPWIDRYGRSPYDIYLPMSVSRIDGNGRTRTATHLDLLTADDSYGRMPRDVPREVSAHVLAARALAPDAPGTIVWIHPFDEYHKMTFEEGRPEEVVYGDWFVKEMIDGGVPVNTIVSTSNFVKSATDPELYASSILLTPAPGKGEVADKLIAHVERGGKALLFGPLRNADPRLLDLLGIRLDKPLEGEFNLKRNGMKGRDAIEDGEYPEKVTHLALLCAGGLEEVAVDDRKPPLAFYENPDGKRLAAAVAEKTEWNGGKLVWIRGTSSCGSGGNGYEGAYFSAEDPTEFFHGGKLGRFALEEFGLVIACDKNGLKSRDQGLTVARHDGGLIFSGLNWNTSEKLRLSFPEGAPVLIGRETKIRDGVSEYFLPRGWQYECRVFVEQKSGCVSCLERPSTDVIRPVAEKIRRRIFLSGLENATVRFMPEAPRREGEDIGMVLTKSNRDNGVRGGETVKIEQKICPLAGKVWEAVGVTGNLVILW